MVATALQSLAGHQDSDQEESKLLITDTELVYEISKNDPMHV